MIDAVSTQTVGPLDLFESILRYGLRNRLSWYHQHINCDFSDLQTDGSKWGPSKKARTNGMLGSKLDSAVFQGSLVLWGLLVQDFHGFRQ